jgi:hypothetical protein
MSGPASVLLLHLKAKLQDTWTVRWLFLTTPYILRAITIQLIIVSNGLDAARILPSLWCTCIVPP